MKKSIFFLLLGSLAFMGCHKPDSTPYLYKKTDKSPLLKDRPENFLQAFAVSVDVSLLSSLRDSRLKFILPKKEVVGIRENLEQVNQGVVWVGKIEGDPGSSVIFTQYNRIVTGNIRLSDGSLFVLQFAGGEIYELQQLDPSKFGEEAEPLRPQKPNEPPQAFDTACPNTDPADNIDVMVAYTATARAAAGGTDAIIAHIYLAVYETNQIYVNSNVNQRLRLVHIEEVAYTETGNANTDLTLLQGTTDGTMDALHASRDAHSADCVVLLEENLGAGIAGLGYFMSTITTGFAPWAFAVVKRTAATGYYSFAHELGHNMGMDHNCSNAGGGGAYPFDHGWLNSAPTNGGTPWRTVMSYGSTLVRIPYFSNPNINYPTALGDPLGSTTGSCLADNHQVLNNTALTVANFRCHSSHSSNVWMKDTWNDTGAEPDPATAAEDMWISPYIWIRNTQDIGMLHQHQHENPILGQTNWVYVKVHNGGATPSTGTLEVWWANASVSLTWPSGWTLLSSTLRSLPPSSSTVVEMPPWTSLPGAGHYCLLARWVSTTDPMHVPEGSDINANTRNNNNIVWRNVNIVTPDVTGDVAFQFANVDRRSVLRFKFKDDYPFKSFAREGTVRIRFDKETAQLVRQAPLDEKVAKRDGEGYVLTGNSSTIDFIVPSDKPVQGQAFLTFNRKPETAQRDYILDVTHLQQKENTLSPVGGIRYEIRMQK